MATLTAEELRRCTAFEERWDPLLGGPATRPYREVGLFSLSRLIAHGAVPDDVLRYVGACFDLLGGLEDDGLPPEEGQA